MLPKLAQYYRKWIIKECPMFIWWRQLKCQNQRDLYQALELPQLDNKFEKKMNPFKVDPKKKSKIKGCQRYITIKKSLPLAANINWKPSSSLKKYDRNVKKVNNLTSYWFFIFSWIKEDYILLTCLLCCTSDFKFLKINEEKTQYKYSYQFSNWVILFLRIVSLGVYHI